MKTTEEKRRAVFEYMKNQDKNYLASLIMSLMTNKDINYEYSNLPRNYKK